MGVKGFVEGGIASIVAGCSTHPLDLIKVRMQLQGESAAALRRRRRLRAQDRAGRGAHGALQGLHPHRHAPGTLHGRALRHARAGAQGLQGHGFLGPPTTTTMMTTTTSLPPPPSLPPR
ncbi:hypothetical protein PR202_ga21283 [Eleusine coracana subsp. coracana]|uniref:Uncharacterized protein n=1 Tax=Eleusine coracana subsp. coracana TaxID=191504 RepID=A0AAV5D105_ELECO|nr:hypothetical protein PR202_ga21283 [Eleusine coracana subsp. coracana]